MSVEIVEAYGKADEIRELFGEYMEMLLTNESRFASYLKIQNYADEFENPAHKYAMPDGRLYLVYCDGSLAGCIGLKKLDGKSCELKRLYVRNEYRSHGVGGALVRRIISDARKIGYKHIMLDTFAFLESAIRLYHSFGFYEVESYNGSPMDNLIYLRLDL
ncbi:MAG: GNAT family N-acetyltransferase [Clostridia bacterium]|nr:GNAT family N-acetyltransferase [Clostridia bacterium]